MEIICAQCSKILFVHDDADNCSPLSKAHELGFIFKNPILFTGKNQSLYFCGVNHKDEYFEKNIPKNKAVSDALEEIKKDIPNASKIIADKMDLLIKTLKSKK